MPRPPSPRATPVLYTAAATCAVLGALLWMRDRSSTPPKVYGDAFVVDARTTSDWRVWSQAVTEQRLGIYLVVAGLVLAAGTALLGALRARRG